ncbi:NAD-dependent epimerase/dehydratase family protein [Polycladomyces abyssicola]|uniref:NAD-dependent epimerase/dehydratase family protein n=1 Tax=Polycladomyces abyssicola TaxID=1125966 RepID=UPI003B82FCF2
MSTAGFKGSWLCLLVVENGGAIDWIQIASPYHPCLFEQLHLDKEMPCIQKDIRDPDRIREAIQQHRPHIIIHLATQPLCPARVKHRTFTASYSCILVRDC